MTCFLGVLGLSAVVAGVAMIYLPAAFIVAGVLALMMIAGYERGDSE